jgi:hypothetical protein
MRTLKSRIALAATLAAISLPTLADDASTCAVCADGTWPALEQPAPAFTTRGGAVEAEALRLAEPTWPSSIAAALPGMRLVARPDDGPKLDPAGPVEREVEYVLVLGDPATSIAKR